MENSENIDIQKATDFVLKGIRSDDTRKNLLIIINTILEEMEKNPDRCIQGNRLQELCTGEDRIPYLTTYYRLLKKLVESKIVHIIEPKQRPKTKGKKPKFYSIPDGFNPLVLESRESLLDRCIFLEKRLKDCEKLLKER